MASIVLIRGEGNMYPRARRAPDFGVRVTVCVVRIRFAGNSATLHRFELLAEDPLHDEEAASALRRPKSLSTETGAFPQAPRLR
jgi:hypothetical protein